MAISMTISSVTPVGATTGLAGIADEMIIEDAPAEVIDEIITEEEGNKKVTAGKNKDIEVLEKNPYRYYYASTGEEIPVSAIVPAGTEIKVTVNIRCTEASPFYVRNNPENNNKLLTGYYRILGTGKDISKASIKIAPTFKLYFSNGSAIMLPYGSDDIVVSYGSGKNRVVLSPEDYEIVSITGNEFLGKATITFSGKGEYGGINKVSCAVVRRDI